MLNPRVLILFGLYKQKVEESNNNNKTTTVY